MLECTVAKRIRQLHHELYILKDSEWQLSWGTFPDKRQNGECDVSQFLFGLISDVPFL